MSYFHDPVSEMTAQETREANERHLEQERRAELVACPCGDRVHASKLTYVEGEGALCPVCYSLWKLDNL